MKLYRVRERQWQAYLRREKKHGRTLTTSTYATRWAKHSPRRRPRYVTKRKPWEARSWHAYCGRYHDYDADCVRLTRDHGVPTSSADLAYGRLLAGG